jgi:hypothetical protein
MQVMLDCLQISFSFSRTTNDRFGCRTFISLAVAMPTMPPPTTATSKSTPSALWLAKLKIQLYNTEICSIMAGKSKLYNTEICSIMAGKSRNSVIQYTNLLHQY